MANQSALGGVKRHSSGVKHFLEGVEKNLGGFSPPNPPQKIHPWCQWLGHKSEFTFNLVLSAVDVSLEIHLECCLKNGL